MDIATLLSMSKNIAVVGLSNRTDRPSYAVASSLQDGGLRILPVNPSYAGSRILGEPCVATLADIDVPIDVVNCFRRSDDMVSVAVELCAMNPLPKCLWMQVGVRNEAAAKIARDIGMFVVDNCCLKTAFLAQRREFNA